VWCYWTSVTSGLAETYGPGSPKELSDDQIQLLKTEGDAKRAELIGILHACGIDKGRLTGVDHEQLHDLIVGLAAFKKECFQKLFAQFLGRTGGTVDAVCRHLVLYMFKTVPFAESPKDAVDLLFLFKHLPLCVFFDYWCGAERELQRQAAEAGVEFGPRAGGLLLESDMKWAQAEGHLPVSIPALAHEAPSFSLSDHELKASSALPDINIKRDPHPQAPACLMCVLEHDRLHEVPHKNCTCRDPDHVKELRGVNTESAEQHNALKKKTDPFLRNESPQRNIFMHLVLAHLHNYKWNKAKFEEMRAERARKEKLEPHFSWVLTFNEFGQVVLSKHARR
jgi:hypothetical protein